jgi:glycosyltransferase involved in cell wall biosynthesis
MTIAFVLPHLADRFGGPVTVVKGIGSRLAKRGHEVSCWGTVDSNEGESPASLPNAHGYPVHWPRSWYRSRGLATGLSVAASDIDLMHVSLLWLYPPYIASRIAGARHIPYILAPSGTLERWALKKRRLKWLKKAIYLNITARTTMDGAACLHACSGKEAENFRAVGYKGPIAIIPNGIDASEFAPGEPAEAEAYWPRLKGRPVVAFMSRLSQEKGLDILVPLWAEMIKSRSYRDAILVIAGPDDRGYAKRVEAMVDRYGIGSHVMLPGMIQGQKKLALLRRADIFILPSYSENFGIVVAEALACGTPVITTTGTPWQELQEVDAGRWVLPSRPELAQALRELLDMSQSQREAMGQRGRTLVEQNYMWDAIVQKFETVCHCIRNGDSIPLYPRCKGD